MLRGRKIRIDLAEQNQQEGRSDGDWRRGQGGDSGGGGFDRGGSDRGGDPDRTEGDWRRKPPSDSFNDDREWTIYGICNLQSILDKKNESALRK